MNVLHWLPVNVAGGSSLQEKFSMYLVGIYFYIVMIIYNKVVELLFTTSDAKQTRRHFICMKTLYNKKNFSSSQTKPKLEQKKVGCGGRKLTGTS